MNTAHTKAVSAHLITPSSEEQTVLQTIQASECGLALPELAKRLQKPRRALSGVLSALVLRGALETVGELQAKRYRLPNQMTTARTITATSSAGHYQGADLERNPGLSASRFAAFELPSRIGSRRYYPDVRVEVVS